MTGQPFGYAQGLPICLIFGRRSGTSSMTKELVERRFPVREPLDRDPYPAQPEGHFENTIARGINQGLLEHFHMRPGDPGLIPFQVCPVLRTWVDRHPGPFIVKDPGLDLTWPVWARTLPHRRLIGIWCCRPKVDRIASLVKRYNIPEDNARWAVEMYDICVSAVRTYIPTTHIDLYDTDRIEQAIHWLEGNGIHPMSVPETKGDPVLCPP